MKIDWSLPKELEVWWEEWLRVIWCHLLDQVALETTDGLVY